MKQIIYIVGPTGTGKTDLALEVAPQMGASILNADSVQFYKDVHIGANKPSETQRRICPHHLWDWVSYPDEATAGTYVRCVDQVLRGGPEQKLYLLVGGSGFYIQALEKGMYDVKDIAPDILEKVERLGRAGELYSELQALDPQAAAKIHPNDEYRLARALQLVLSEGKSLEEIRSSETKNMAPTFQGYKLRKVGLDMDRVELKKRIEKRTQNMLKSGLLDEVRELLATRSANWSPLKSIGYAESVSYLKGEISDQELPALIVKNTMALAKKQRTWFRRDSDIRWFDAISERTQAATYILNHSPITGEK